MKSETMPKKKKSYLSRLGMTLLTILLIVLFIFIMSLVSKIQGTARVVNYAGLVRGKTQRIIKLEISGSPQDEMIADERTGCLFFPVKRRGRPSPYEGLP